MIDPERVQNIIRCNFDQLKEKIDGSALTTADAMKARCSTLVNLQFGSLMKEINDAVKQFTGRKAVRFHCGPINNAIRDEVEACKNCGDTMEGIGNAVVR